ncbi:ferritin-like domain-containing protein [Halomarina oriensis]|uniref:Ferritin-like domain-containing protein n=1 Tax=Halomarina oriensis TaxID=671145 RepID=A0A6B0GU33_9EURY|nr:ferritin-like domain-containing protein [Halomarina oriensis]MWG36113.1 ferritin-like domain-containing protein [Halomarina oriensis]
MTDDTNPIARVYNGANDMLTDRRSFMNGAAKLGLGGALLSYVGSDNVMAQEEDGMDEVTDIDILNYALTLEHLEANYYTEALEIYSEDDFEGFGSPGMETFSGGRPRYGTYQQYEKIRDHEVAHVETLSSVIEDLGGTPVEAAEYEFPYSSIQEFVELSATIEDVGVSAYAGAAPLIENDDLLAAALSIHSVEARHATYIRLQRERSIPFQAEDGAFDPARTMDEVIAIASQFIVSD